jgi:hypothetical protein
VRRCVLLDLCGFQADQSVIADDCKRKSRQITLERIASEHAFGPLHQQCRFEAISQPNQRSQTGHTTDSIAQLVQTGRPVWPESAENPE